MNPQIQFQTGNSVIFASSLSWDDKKAFFPIANTTKF